MKRPAAKRPGAGVTVDRARLVRLRQEAMLSRADLARKMSDGPDGEFTITPDAIAKIENGFRRPKPATLARLCMALGVGSDQLLPSSAPDTEPCDDCGTMTGDHLPACREAT